jgi:hypothetical protein
LSAHDEIQFIAEDAILVVCGEVDKRHVAPSATACVANGRRANMSRYAISRLLIGPFSPPRKQIPQRPRSRLDPVED